MVGFPGETEEQFQRMRQFIVDHPFDRVGAFAFSPEEGTHAANLPDQLPEEVKQRRLGELMQPQQAVSAARNRARIGKQVEVLAEGYDGTRAFGRSYAEAPDVDGRVYFTAKTLPAVGSMFRSN
jgi:ribosomal protein S12 methylthiotransferase